VEEVQIAQSGRYLAEADLSQEDLYLDAISTCNRSVQ